MWLKILVTVLILSSMSGIYMLIDRMGVTDLIVDIDILILRVRALGSIGPLMVIGLMLLAIVFNPLPSAPIALAAGAVYGHTWGTIYIIIGALSGSMIAFIIARISGHELFHKVTENRWSLGRFGSQNALMMMIFISRPIPFMSFDLVSYAAGLTTITLWRFVIATLFGLIPASFLLAHFGGEMVQADLQLITIALVAIGLITLVPVVAIKLINKHKTDSEQKRANY